MAAAPDFDELFNVVKWIIVFAVIFIPLGIWKAVELVIWCVNHISFN